MTKKYDVIFSGEIHANASIGNVKQNLGKILRLPAERVDQLFANGSVLIKQGVDKALADKFQSAFQRAGALCELKRVELNLSLEPQEDVNVEEESASCPRCDYEQLMGEYHKN